MVICGSYMFEYSVSKDTEAGKNEQVHRKGGGNMEGSGTLMSNIDCLGIEN